MATSANWTVIFDDKKIMNHSVKQDNGSPQSYVIEDDAFWNDSKFSNIWAIQHGTNPASDEVEHRDTTPHCSYAEANLGDFSEFTNRWDSAHLNQLQLDWDNDNVDGESEEDKIARLGARPTSYSS
jgi:hypothetical protein|tara:strand:+ start:610 stop:987 length:378 start_codon:yes stop_codon:yes gene_type:complete